MAHKLGDRVKELSSTSGLTAFTLSGAVSGFATFASVLTADGDTTWYCAVNGTEWEVGLGTRTSATALARTTLLASSTGSAVNFSAPPTVFCTYPASQILPTFPKTPDTFPTTPNAADDEFETAALDTGGTRRSGAAAWAWRNQGTAAVAQAGGRLVLTMPSSAGHDVRVIEQTLPGSGTWKYRAKVRLDTDGQPSGSASLVSGICLVVSGTNKAIIFGGTRDTASNAGFLIARYTNLQTWASNAYSAVGATIATDVLARFGLPYDFRYFEIEWDATNLIFRLSACGTPGTFIQLFAETPAAFLGTPDKIGVFGNFVGGTGRTVVDWFRRVA